MVLNLRASFALVFSIFIWLHSTRFIHAAQSDIDCLRSIKASLHDPSNYLESWNFTNGAKTNICSFLGIDCWNADDNRVLNINLSGLGLVGKFPLGVSNCTSMTGLDLSNNNLNSHIPKNISHYTPFVTSLDLSTNRFSGKIPENLANCSYLNFLKLNNNNLTGQIPEQIGQLKRIRTFDVSNNRLSGRVPDFENNTAVVVNYANNAGLCGGPLSPCKH
ncbi:hypothetical protein CASFOL_005649 [Castilleja foliolosa]|uniref:Leucine-rich repeat-containing N-terminal plant-type domain-containing protein n=1 Tax=Castilleja foliolosa TaxID=1961234 RepID=A0ABD3E549_9LAMI